MIANVLGLREQRRPWSSGKRHCHSTKKNLARLAREQSLSPVAKPYLLTGAVWNSIIIEFRLFRYLKDQVGQQYVIVSGNRPALLVVAKTSKIMVPCCLLLVASLGLTKLPVQEVHM
jgi:hypothetical protein